MRSSLGMGIARIFFLGGNTFSKNSQKIFNKYSKNFQKYSKNFKNSQKNFQKKFAKNALFSIVFSQFSEARGQFLPKIFEKIVKNALI